jgi:hypothetical protein
VSDDEISAKVAGLPAASINLSGTFDFGAEDVARIFDVPAELLHMAVHAPDGCLLLKGPITRSEYAAGKFEGTLGGLDYDGRLPGGKHIHTLPWHRRGWRRKRPSWSRLRLRFGSWIAGVDLDERDEW